MAYFQQLANKLYESKLAHYPVMGLEAVVVCGA